MKECCDTGAPKKRSWHWVLLGFVALLAGGLLVGQHRFEQVRAVDAMSEIRWIEGALEEYAKNNGGSYPSSLQPLVTPDVNGHCYLEDYGGRVPRDPWGREYRYEPPSAAHPRPRVLTYGADGKPGGSGADADIDGAEFAGRR